MTDPSDEPASISFRILLAAAALYLVVRFAQGIAWVVERVR